MLKKPFSKSKADHFTDALNSVSVNKEVPKSAYVLLLLLYLIANTFTRNLSQSQDVFMINGYALPLTMLSGITASLGNICILLIVILFGKFGYISTIVIFIAQFPRLLMSIFLGHNYAAIQGIFTGLLTILASTIIFLNHLRVVNYQKKMREQAITDQLTGIPNRFACFELMNDLIARHERFALISTDLNNFKSINDTMGHTVGNEVLIEICRRWIDIASDANSQTHDFLARPGGDEFLLVIRDYNDNEGILRAIRRYQEALEEKITIDDCDYFLNASFGYAEYPTDATSSITLVSYADTAMHEIKRSNKSERILRFTQDLSQIEKNLATERKIRNALENDAIFFHLQPQYSIDHKLRGFEALARMKDADGTMISPGEFIPVAEKIGLIDKLDLCVFRKSALFFGELLRKTGADITLSINVSVRHLMKNNFMDEIRDILTQSGVTPDHLEIEITESIMIDSIDKALEVIGEIKNLGIKIAIDDFGTGYSSLSYLNKFPADLLKIDKSFIDEMNSGESSKQYVATIISIGHIMNLEVISEGVEDPEQLETLRSIGCDYIQGYIWGKPLPQEEADALVCDIMKK